MNNTEVPDKQDLRATLQVVARSCWRNKSTAREIAATSCDSSVPVPFAVSQRPHAVQMQHGRREGPLYLCSAALVHVVVACKRVHRSPSYTRLLSTFTAQGCAGRLTGAPGEVIFCETLHGEGFCQKLCKRRASRANRGQAVHGGKASRAKQRGSRTLGASACAHRGCTRFALSFLVRR